MTIVERIKQELIRIQSENESLYDLCNRLNISSGKIITQVSAHLKNILNQMPDYDKHDSQHSEKVLENIEKMLRDNGIENLTLLEALVLRICCYLHDAGMILPAYCTALLEEVEDEAYVFHREKPLTTIKAELRSKLAGLNKTYADVRDQFFCQDSEEKYLDFLSKQIYDYEQYRLGLPELEEGKDRKAFCLTTRQGYLRSTHGERVKLYAQNLARMLDGIPDADGVTLAETIGQICASHCQEISDVRKLHHNLQICRAHCTGTEMSCNVRYMSMLLRLGDVIHFSEDRVSRTLYAEHMPMDHESDMHWRTKFGDVTYSIIENGSNLDIAFHGGFRKPEEYYFLQDYLNWVDEELGNYAEFQSEMERIGNAERYRLGLTNLVNRDDVKAIDFVPDKDLKFKLEHQKIIQLLMGMRLYRDEFMCLRELYQNALDACRCMWAENDRNGLNGNLEIEFGLGRDDGGDYLYCKDQGTGMTMSIVKNYLLRVGNSYYKSAEFRQKNASWSNSVAPVSEFGIGMLSCYMIADRIEVITRHYTAVREKPIWVCMEGSNDYGYFRMTTDSHEEQLGEHGTIVKLYLKEEYREKATGYLPENPTDDTFELDIHTHISRTLFDLPFESNPSKHPELPPETQQRLSDYSNSLYHRVQSFVHIPESRFPVYISNGTSRKDRLITSNESYPLSNRLVPLVQSGFTIRGILDSRDMFPGILFIMHMLSGKSEIESAEAISTWMKQFITYPCSIRDTVSKIEVFSILHLPNVAEFDNSLDFTFFMDQTIVDNQNNVYIDGMPIDMDFVSRDSFTHSSENYIKYNFFGSLRPELTVDRGSIRHIAPAVVNAAESLIIPLIEKIIQQIEDHFQEYEQAASAEALDYVMHYLHRKYPSDVFYRIVHRLSRSIFQSYPVNGIELDKLFHNSRITAGGLGINSDVECIADLFSIVLSNATQITVNGDCITIENPPEQSEELLDSLTRHTTLMIMADEWTGDYSQYDVVKDLWPLVPKRLFDRYDQKALNSRTRIFLGGYSGLRPIEIASFDPVRFRHHHNIDMLPDVLLLLEENAENRSIHRCRLDGIEDKDDKRYVIYAYINPRPLHENDETLVKQYERIPKYRQGVEEGWSLLFYRYKDGYTIAPGIVDRMDMIKLLPKEALEHNDDIEYCFTDGTHAF